LHGSAPKDSAAAPASPPAPIVAGTVAQHDVPIYLTGVGTVIAYNTVVIRSQILGQIVSINFTEGQAVHTGDLLAQIDPRPYQAQIDQYTATRDRDQAQLVNAQANLDRYTPLESKGYATPQLVDTQKAQVAQLQNAVKADEALIEAAKVQLSFTRLTSPIDGVVGIRPSKRRSGPPTGSAPPRPPPTSARADWRRACPARSGKAPDRGWPRAGRGRLCLGE
jgi:membrane fusion protein, multidrug efflux system